MCSIQARALFSFNALKGYEILTGKEFEFEKKKRGGGNKNNSTSVGVFHSKEAMPTKLVFSGALARQASRFVLIGRQSELVSAVASSDSLVLQLPRVNDSSAVSRMCSAAVSRLGSEESPFSGATSSITAPASGSEETEPFVRIIFLGVPSTATRFNSVVRPDVIARHSNSFVKSEYGRDGEEIQVVYVLPENEHPSASHKAMCLSVTNALARSLPIYTRKGNARETNSKLTVHVAFSFANGKMYGDDTLFNSLGAVAECVRRCAAQVDAPCNEMHSAIFAQQAIDLASQLSGVSTEEIVGEELAARGFGGIYGVGKASVNPPRLVILKYTPENAAKTVAMCGKGIVYDTGGLSIKGKTTMPGMKCDMGGAAAVLNAFLAGVKCGFQDNLYCLLAIAENSVGPHATRPDDIHVLYSGKTVEINNTDAEGRLVLGDAVAYAAKHLNPDILIDMCTLTGAQGVSTGKAHAAIVCSDEKLEQDTIRAGRASGDLVHPLMWCPELFANEFSSKVADMKNSVGNRSNAQVSCAAQFICNHLPSGFTDKHSWLHIDMAAPAFVSERGTGYGVSLLLQLLALKF